MSAEIFTKVQQAAADIFQLPKEKILPESSPEGVEEWDSVRHLNLILALEEEFNLRFEPEEIDLMKSIGQIVALIDAKLDQSA